VDDRKRRRATGGPAGAPVWTLTATIARVDAFMARQRPLLFSAPRAGGFWIWPIEEITIGTTTLTARLGPPEQ
jgi:hypothetical protein